MHLFIYFDREYMDVEFRVDLSDLAARVEWNSQGMGFKPINCTVNDLLRDGAATIVTWWCEEECEQLTPEEVAEAVTTMRFETRKDS